MENRHTKSKRRDEKRMVNYFFDSYAVIEMIKKNPNYSTFSNETFVLTNLNLAEIYYYALLNLTKSKSEEIFEKLSKAVVEIDLTTIKLAMQLKKENKKKKLSYADCIGYAYAKNNNLLFVTGDVQFQTMEKVVYIK